MDRTPRGHVELNAVVVFGHHVCFPPGLARPYYAQRPSIQAVVTGVFPPPVYTRLWVYAHSLSHIAQRSPPNKPPTPNPCRQSPLTILVDIENGTDDRQAFKSTGHSAARGLRREVVVTYLQYFAANRLAKNMIIT